MTLETIQAPIQSQLDATEAKMQSAMASDVPLIDEVNHHIIQGGKRVRPITALLIAGLFGSINDQHLAVSAIIEFVHTATLLHDDVVDNSTKRRGQETANEIWGNETSVLVGDFLYSRAFQLITDIQNQSLMSILSEASNVMAEGEVLQLMNRHNPEISKDTYYKIIEAKTAKLFQAASSMSATVSGASESDIQKAADFGLHLGLAFQLIDDALDYKGDSEALGKNIGDDIAEGKATLPLIYAMSVAEQTDKADITQIIAMGEGETESLDKVQLIIEKYNAVEHTISTAKQHCEQALAAIQPFPDSEYKQSLADLVEFVASRAY